MDIFKYAIIASASLCLSACTGRTLKQHLDDIASFIQERPDSALSALEAVDSAELCTKALRAKYSLLHAMALDKNYIDTTDIGIIRPAVAYYGKSGSASEKMLASYYAGRIYYNGGDYPNAILSYNQSLQYVSEEDNYGKGLVYGAIGDAYNASFNNMEELKYVVKAHECFEKLGEKRRLDVSKYKMGQAYHNNGQYDIADSLFSSVYSRSDSTSTIAFFAMLAQADNVLKSGNADPRKAIGLFEYVISHGGTLSVEAYYEYAYAFLLVGETDNARNLLSQLPTDEGRKGTLAMRFHIAELSGDTDLALSLLKELSAYQDDVVTEQLAQSVFKAQSEHYLLTARLAEQKSTIANQRSIIYIAWGILLLVISIVVFKAKRDALIREKDRLSQAVEESEKMLEAIRIKSGEESEGSRRDIVGLQKDNEAWRKKIEELRNMYASLYQKQFNEIGKYYDPSFAHRPDSISEQALRNARTSISSLLVEISGGSESQGKFEQRINEDIHNIIVKIRKDFPKFDDKDIRFICYMIVGFDTSTISFLMDMSKENVRVKRHRLRTKLHGKDSPNGDLYKIFT